MKRIVKCIVCEHDIVSIYDEDKERQAPTDAPENYDPIVATMWNGGTCDIIYPGYGSNRDTSKIRIAICDDCLDKKISNGVVQHLGYYL